MINLSLAFEKFVFLTQLSKEECEPWRMTLKALATSLEHRLKEDADTLEFEYALAEAVASDAYYRFCLRNVDSDIWVSAGNVDVKTDPKVRLEAAEKLRYDGLLCIADLLTDTRFMFKGM